MADKKQSSAQTKPPQTQARQPGRQREMSPPPEDIRADYRGSAKLKDRVALITGGDSGIGRAIAVHFAREGADVAIVYLEESQDAKDTEAAVQREGRRCLLHRTDIRNEQLCEAAVREVLDAWQRLDILVNNAAVQHPRGDIVEIGADTLRATFETNIFAMFYLIKAALPALRESKGCIINTTSVTAYRGNPMLLDYSATKGAIVAFTRSLALNLAAEGIRVNAVAPGPIWTPLIPSTFPEEKVGSFGSGAALGRPGEPSECAPAYVFLASQDASYMTGQVLHPNGGDIING